MFQAVFGNVLDDFPGVEKQETAALSGVSFLAAGEVDQKSRVVQSEFLVAILIALNLFHQVTFIRTFTAIVLRFRRGLCV